MKQIQEIKSDFEQILSEVIKINGIPIESATQVAQVILQESGKFQRTEMMNNARLKSNGNANNNNGGQPATFKQKNALDNFGIKYSEDITKAEASALLEKAIAEAKKKRGGVITAPLSASRETQEEAESEDTEEQNTEWCPHCDREAHDESDCPAFASFYSD